MSEHHYCITDGEHYCLTHHMYRYTEGMDAVVADYFATHDAGVLPPDRQEWGWERVAEGQLVEGGFIEIEVLAQDSEGSHRLRIERAGNRYRLRVTDADAEFDAIVGDFNAPTD